MKFSTPILLFFIVIFAILILGKPICVFAADTCPSGSICLYNPLKATDINGVIYGVMNLLKVAAIPIGIIMIIWGGIQIMTASGKEEQLNKGKKTLMWTIIGLAIVFAVNFLVGFILELMGGPPVG